MRPMTIVVVREVPAGGSEAGASVFGERRTPSSPAPGRTRWRSRARPLPGLRRSSRARRLRRGGVGRRGGARRRLGETGGCGEEDHGEGCGERGAAFHGRGNYRSRRGASSAARGRMNRARDLRRLDAAVFLSGAALMGLEIVGSRVLAPVFGTSLFVWGALITTFLAALAAGYALGGRLADRRPDLSLLAVRPRRRRRPRDRPLRGAGLRARGGQRRSRAGPLPGAPRGGRAVRPSERPHGRRDALRGATRRKGARARRLGGGAALGRLDDGLVLGAFSTAFFLIPTFATRPILFGLGASLLAAALLIPAPRVLRRLAFATFVGTGAALVFLVGPGIAKPAAPAGTLVFEKETAYHHIRVVDQGLRRALYFDNRMQGYAPVRQGSRSS